MIKIMSPYTFGVGISIGLLMLLPSPVYAGCPNPETPLVKKWTNNHFIFVGTPKSDSNLNLTDTKLLEPTEAYPMKFLILDMVKESPEIKYTDANAQELAVQFIPNWQCNKSCTGEIKKFNKGDQYLVHGRIRNGQLFVHPITIKKLTGTPEEVREILLLKRFSNLKDGEVLQELHPSQNIKFEGTVKSGRLDGHVKTYYENGNIMSITNYKNGNVDGKARFFYPSGNIRSVQTCMNGKLCSPNMLYWENGKRQKGIMFDKKCNMLGVIEFDQEGNEIKRTEY